MHHIRAILVFWNTSESDSR